jgi:hypothetical protein
VLGAWLAEESLALTTQLYQLLPTLLNMCEACLQLAQAETERGETEGAGIVENPLKFLLPGLSHLVADNAPRAIVKTILPQLLLQYMTVLYSSGTISLMSSEAVSSFTLSVEVLLTVCVCEVELRRSSVFSEIAQLISKLLVSGGLSLRLALQAALLWMMIAREQGIS